MNKDILVEQDVFNNIVELASKREKVEYGRFPNGVNSSDEDALSEALTPIEETEALKKAIENLSPDHVRELSAIMYLGRDNSDDVVTETAFALYREDAEKRELEDVKRSLLEKTPLAQYLLNGVNKLNAN